MENFETLSIRCDEDSEISKMKKWGIVGKDGEVKGLVLQETPKRWKGVAKRNKLLPSVYAPTSITCFNYLLSSNLFNTAPYQKTEETTYKERLLMKRIALLEAQCSFFAQKFKELEGQNVIKRPEEPKVSEIIYQEHKEELEQKFYGKIVAIDNAERKIMGVGDTILEAYDNARKVSEKDKFSYIRVGYTDRL